MENEEMAQAQISLELLRLNQMHMVDMRRMSRQRYKDSTRREAGREALQETNQRLTFRTIVSKDLFKIAKLTTT